MTEEIKKALESAKTDEEKKAVLEKYKDVVKALSEEELGDVTGGSVVISDPLAGVISLEELLRKLGISIK